MKHKLTKSFCLFVFCCNNPPSLRKICLEKMLRRTRVNSREGMEMFAQRSYTPLNFQQVVAHLSLKSTVSFVQNFMFPFKIEEVNYLSFQKKKSLKFHQILHLSPSLPIYILIGSKC